MKQNKLKSSIRKLNPQKRRAVAEVISSLLLIVITVVGAIILTTFLDETFIAGGLSVSAGTDSSLKTIKLTAFDTRDGEELMNPSYKINNQDYFLDPIDGHLCRDGVLSFNANSSTVCNSNPNQSPANGGTAYVVIQIENRGINPIWLSDVYLDSVGHVWDSSTSNIQLDGSVDPIAGNGKVPRDGMFSILPVNELVQKDNQIPGGKTVNLVVKLDSVNPDIPLSKTIRVQLNIGTNTLQEFLIESGGAQ